MKGVLRGILTHDDDYVDFAPWAVSVFSRFSMQFVYPVVTKNSAARLCYR